MSSMDKAWSLIDAMANDEIVGDLPEGGISVGAVADYFGCSLVEASKIGREATAIIRRFERGLSVSR